MSTTSYYICLVALNVFWEKVRNSRRKVIENFRILSGTIINSTALVLQGRNSTPSKWHDSRPNLNREKPQRILLLTNSRLYNIHFIESLLTTLTKCLPITKFSTLSFMAWLWLPDPCSPLVVLNGRTDTHRWVSFRFAFNCYQLRLIVPLRTGKKRRSLPLPLESCQFWQKLELTVVRYI